MKKNYTKSFLLFVHIILGAGLTAFTLIPMGDYKRNVIIAFVISISILLFYFLTLKKSATLFNEGRVGFAYFIAVAGFFSLIFIQFMNCANSIVFH